MTRKETIAEGIDLYLGDCREILPTLGKVDAVVTDPPYGNKHSGDSARFSGGQTRRGKGTTHGRIVGDGEAFNPAPFMLGDNQIFFGANSSVSRMRFTSSATASRRKNYDNPRQALWRGAD